LFVDDPFGGGRMYRTGDRARLMSDGNIMFLGRRDHQVKIRGQRVELEEIERVIGRHPAVRQVVVRVDRSPGDGRLVAHVVASASVISDEELKRFAAERLPSAMLPSVFDRLDALPLNVHGKIDRDALARRALPAPASSSAYEAPETRLQEQIARVWKETLGVDRVGLHDNFFDIGGHSLAVLQVHARLSALLERSLHPMDLFRHPTIAAMAEFLEGRTQEQAGAEQGRQRAARARDALLRFRKPSGSDGGQR
jgi:aryl carrier-like protein